MTLIGRFPQADSIVPQPGNPQALNRYSYTLNNPLRYTDPTGHAFDEGNLGGDVEDWMTVLQRNPSQAFRGWLHERDSAWTVLLYNQQHGAPQEVIEVLQAGLASRQAALDTNGYRGTAQAVSSAFDASAPGVGPGLVGLTAGLSAMGAPALSSWLSKVPVEYQASVARSFSGTPNVETLTEDLIVYRHWGSEAGETGSPWFSPKPYVRPGNARRYLALPEYNTAENVSSFRIPAGTMIIRGKVASKVGTVNFGSYATGGGTQIYLPDPNVAVLIGPMDATR